MSPRLKRVKEGKCVQDQCRSPSLLCGCQHFSGSSMSNLWGVKYGTMRETLSVVMTMLLLQASIFTRAKETTCIMKAVSRGETAKLECFFGENMATSHHEIFVQRKLGDSSKPGHVLDCYWRNGSYTCAPTSPFVFDGNISDSLTLDLPNAQSRDEGNYFCEVLKDAFSYKPCKFDTLPAIENENAAVKEDAGLGESNGANSSLGASTEEVTTKTFQAEKSEFKENTASSSLKSEAIIGISVVAVVVVLAVVALCVIVHVGRQRRQKRKIRLPLSDKEDHLDGLADVEHTMLQTL